MHVYCAEIGIGFLSCRFSKKQLYIANSHSRLNPQKILTSKGDSRLLFIGICRTWIASIATTTPLQHKSSEEKGSVGSQSFSYFSHSGVSAGGIKRALTL